MSRKAKPAVWYHTYGNASDGATRLLTVSSADGPDNLAETEDLIGAIANKRLWAYLGSLDHAPSDDETDAYIRQVEAHS